MALQNISTTVNGQEERVDIFAGPGGNLIVKILNIHGQFIKTIIKSLQDNAEMVSVKLDDLASGKYVLNIFKDKSFIKSFHFNKN